MEIKSSNTQTIEGTNRVESQPVAAEAPPKISVGRGNANIHWAKCLKLPEIFKVEDLGKIIGLTRNGTSSQIRRWQERGLLKKVGFGQYKRMTDIAIIGSKGKFKCDQCDKSFKNVGGLSIHKYRAHEKKGLAHSKKIAELNRTRLGEIRNPRVVQEEIAPIHEPEHKLRFCPNCACQIEYVPAAIAFKNK